MVHKVLLYVQTIKPGDTSPGLYGTYNEWITELFFVIANFKDRLLEYHRFAKKEIRRMHPQTLSWSI